MILPCYEIHDIVGTKATTGYYFGRFKQTPDPDVCWPHRHDFFSWVWFTHGSGFYAIDFEDYPIKPGRIFTMQPKQVHNWNYAEDTDGYVLILTPELANQIAIWTDCPYYDIPKTAMFLHQLVAQNMIDEQSIGDTDSNKNIIHAITYLLNLGTRYAKRKPSVHPLVADFKVAVTADYNCNHTVYDLATKLGTSEENLVQLCKQHLGTTPKQYQLTLKITEAKRMLLFDRFNNSEVAFKLGFEDVSYFARIFKRKTGYSPSAFREKYRKHL